MVGKWVLTIIAVIGLAFAAAAEEELHSELPSQEKPQSPPLAAAEEKVHWETDYDVALAKAEATGRFVFMNFTGSDWCIYCMVMDKKFFRHKEFIKFAADFFVCLAVDFPRFKEQDEELKKFNKEMAQKHLVRGYPTIIITDDCGKAIGRSGYKRGMDGAQYVEHLTALLGRANLTEPKPPPPENIYEDDLD